MMPDENKKRQEDGSKDPSRRKFFIKIGASSIAVVALGTTVFGYQYLSPNVLFEPSPIVNEGKPEGYEINSVTFDPENTIYIIRDVAGFYSLSAICTHLGCITAWNQVLDMIACPCHGSKFRKDGTKIEGPAPRPLPWLRVWISEDGDLMVDRSVTIAPKEYVRV
jgi:cytochrome b6-f complex iron-sulfur subunit